MARVVVVGAGMGGLAVAARLARAGHRVTVCEQADRVGGKLGRYERDGFSFDLGPSLLTLPAVYRDLFRTTGTPLEDVLDLVPVDPAFRYRFADGTTVDLPNASRAGTAAALDAALGDGAGAQWNGVVDRGGEVWDLTRRAFLETPLRRRSLLLSGWGDWRTVAPWQTLHGLGGQLLRDPRLRMMLDRYATYTGSDPRRAPAALVTVPYVEQAFGAWHVRGGLSRLAMALGDRVRELGADLRLGADVAEITTVGDRADGVRLADGERLPADVVVANADAAEVYGRLLHVPAVRGQLRRLRRATPSLSGFVLLLALHGSTPGLRHHTVLFPADYGAEFDAIFGSRPEPVDDPAVYIAAPDDDAMHPDGAEAWFVLVNAPRQGPVDWQAPGVATGYADRVLAVMAERGYEVRDRLLWSSIRTPADLELATRAPGGAIYGTSSNGARAAFRRPANRSPVPGLFLVGGSAHPGGGLPLVGLSAAIVADLVGAA